MKEATDVRSNPRDQIMHAVESIGRSKQRLKVFKEIYRGKTRVKTIQQIASRTNLTPKRVLDVAFMLYNDRLIDREKVDGRYAFIKDPFFSRHRTQIVRLVENKSSQEKFYTKWNPKPSTSTVVINLPVNKKDVSIEHLTIDDIDSLREVKKIKLAPEAQNQPILEETFQQGLQKILEERGEFHDWGGEGDDLFF